MRRSLLAAVALAVTPVLALPAAAQTGKTAAAEASIARLVEGRTPGKPVSCINLRDIRSTEIVEDTAIVYRMNNGTLFVNRPGSGTILDRDDILVTRTIGTRLCRPDIINLIDRGSRMPSGSIALGDFVPYSQLPRTRS